MIKMVCPECYQHNYTSSPQEKNQCCHCNCSFSIDDVLKKMDGVAGQSKDFGAWISNCAD